MAGTIRIGQHEIGDRTRCYVIAEIGHNHQGSLQKARELFREAKLAGAQAVKLQKRDNRGLYTRAAYQKPYDNENSFGPTYGEHREFLEFGLKEYQELQRYARELGIDFFATAFDAASADFLEGLDVPAYKIASGDVRSTPLLAHVARFGKPIILSTGGALIDDVQRAYDTIMPINPQLGLLQCTAGYPAAFEELDLRVVGQYRERFPGAVIGYSGHDNGIAMPVAAYVLGARIVEKHFTLNRAMKGTDHAFSLEPVGLRKMMRDLERTHAALGDGVKKIYESEKAPIVKMGKSLVVARDLPSGHVLGRSDLVMKSPGGGIPPYELDKVLGRMTLKPLYEDDFLSFDVLSKPNPELARS
ncbi:MAG: N-acetylneuraminate synthase [Acidobacteria bacterium RIFCSPLOWO2_12_FULL_67_14]|nr:MAG: N-acetylneuraminate synthase [Acidobacteria bacterium RIFCSPLOWO2_02_FULL_67_21]OFW36134.1 MAG: N-acetylneuraminate synthase [Acidobacteria bacterium RIFCSPLOWO2_12_FULL_67_14]